MTGNSVFIVTVHDYLAQRDSEWMASIYNYVGLSVGTIFSGMDLKEKKIEYIDAQLTLRADTLVPLDNDMSEKVLNIMEFMDDLDDVQEVHTNAEFPDNFEVKE